MTRLNSHPRVRELARDLDLPWRNAPFEQIRKHAISVVEDCLQRFPDITSLSGLRSALSENLSVCLEVVREDDDLDRIADDYSFSPAEKRRLEREFNHEDVEGWLISNPSWRPERRRYVAVVDGRGERQSRAYFTGWHEITHLIVTPPQLHFDAEGFRRSIPVDKTKDPVESTVDAVTGELAFYRPFVAPVLEEEVGLGRLTFSAIERMRQRVAPEASFYSAAIGAVRLAARPVLLVHVRRAYKNSERRVLAQGQGELGLDLATQNVVPKLRVVDVIPGGPSSRLAIFKNMRVPETSVLAQVFENPEDATRAAEEDQGWWETSSHGHLPACPLHVEAARMGSYVFGLISPI